MRLKVSGALLLAGTAVAGLCLQVDATSAADLPRGRAVLPVASVPSTPTWSGAYIGAHVGYGWADFDFRNPAVTLTAPLLPGGLTVEVPLQRTFEGDSFIGGGQIGINAQWGNLVVGVEGDVSWTGMDGEFRSTAGPFTILGVGPFTTSEGVSADLDVFGTFRARVGFAFNSLLVYGTGGLAVGRVETTGDITGRLGPNFLTLAASGRETHVGWTAGAGVEAMLTPNLSAKVEYLYADLGWERHEGAAAITASPLVAAVLPPGLSARASGDFKVEVQIVKAGLNYRFHLW